MSDRNMSVEIAKTIGEPIDENLKVPVVLSEIADVETAEPGEEVKTYGTADGQADDVYTVDANGKIAVHKVSPNTPAALTFTGLNSKLEYVLVDEILNSPDQQALARKKAGITRAMDKEEVKRICDGILAIPACEVAQATGEDLYDMIVKMKHVVEDFGDNFVLLVGSLVKEKIDTYDKDKVTEFNYRVGLREFLASAGIKVVKVSGLVNGGRLLATDKMILVAKDSTIAVGKPIVFVRRKVSPAIAAQMGAGVDGAQRCVISTETPMVIATDSLNTLAYGVYGYESIVLAILNVKAIAWATFVA
jgi:hypothetical protein